MSKLSDSLPAVDLTELHSLPDDALVLSRDAAAFLNMNPKTLNWYRSQRPHLVPPSVRLGGTTIRYRMSDLRAFVKTRRTGGGQ